MLCVGHQALDGGSEALAQISRFSQRSLALRCLESQIVTAMRMIHFDRAALGERKSLGGGFMRLDLCHSYLPTSRQPYLIFHRLRV